jgi:hypothetical protein
MLTYNSEGWTILKSDDMTAEPRQEENSSLYSLGLQNEFRHSEGIEHTVSDGVHRKLQSKLQKPCPAQQSHSKFSVTNQLDEDLWGDHTNDGVRP